MIHQLSFCRMYSNQARGNYSILCLHDRLFYGANISSVCTTLHNIYKLCVSYSLSYLKFHDHISSNCTKTWVLISDTTSIRLNEYFYPSDIFAVVNNLLILAIVRRSCMPRKAKIPANHIILEVCYADT